MENTTAKNDYLYERVNLFKDWEKTDLHKGKVFTIDGIVDPETWFYINERPRILYLLPETFHDTGGANHRYYLTKALKNESLKSTLWKRLSLWTQGIYSAEGEKNYLTLEERQTFRYIYLGNVAIVNVKKSNAKYKTNRDETLFYAVHDRDFLIRQIEMINPDIIVCCGTFKEFSLIYREDMRYCNELNPHAYTFNRPYKKERLIIDFYHPLKNIPFILSYYGISSIYRDSIRYERFRPEYFQELGEDFDYGDIE